MNFKGDLTHSMDLTVGAIVEGKVKSITKFGAFVALPDGKTGMVHISEIAHAYVSDIHEHLTEGQVVKVMVIAIDPTGKINLSIKKTQPPTPKPQSEKLAERPRGPRSVSSGPSSARPVAVKEPQSFDDMLKQFMADSDSKISSIKQYSDRRSKTRRR